jgi:integrase
MAQKHANGEGSIRPRASGRYEARITVDGQRISHYAATRAEADAWLSAQKVNRDRGLPLILNQKTSLGIYLADWLGRVQPTLRPSTHLRYRELAVHVTAYLGTVPLARLTPAHLERLYAVVQRAPEDGGADLSSTTAHHIHAVLHKALEDAVHEGLLGRNVASIAHSPRLKDFEPTVWSLAEVRTFLQAAARDRFGPLYVITACTGLRSGEVRGLCWKDIDLEGKVLRVRSALDRNKVASPLKTKSSRRRLELPALAISALHTQRARQAEERLALGEAWAHGHDTGLVFTSTIGTALDHAQLLRAFHRLCDAAGLPRIRIHDLRHLQASLLLAAGINPKVVAERLGHARTSITMDTYSHVMPTLQREAADVLDRLLGDWESLQAID